MATKPPMWPWQLLAAGELEQLQKTCPSNFSFAGLNPKTKLPPLIQLMLCKDCLSSTGLQRTAQAAKWLISKGADPTTAPPSVILNAVDGEPLSKKMWHATDKEKTTVTLTAGTHTAISFVLELKGKLTQNTKEHGTDWTRKMAALDKLLDLFTEAAGAAAQAAQQHREKLPIDTAVVDMWDAMLHDAATHDLTIEARDGSVGAHASVLSHASPVLKLMLAAPMLEAQTRRLCVPDAPAHAVALFLEMLYTGTTTLAAPAAEEADNDDATTSALAALELAHRWSVASVQAMTEVLLAEQLRDGTFERIAEAAHLRGSATLADACRKFASKSRAVQADVAARKCSAAVLALLGEAAADEPPAKKPRRSF